MIKLNNILLESLKTRQVDTPEFKSWFNGSKAVDESGNLLVLYHGTNSVIISEPSEVENKTVWVVFDPTPIKSAIGNSGTFDPKSDDILKDNLTN